MLFLKYLLTWGGIAMIATAAGILTYDIRLEMLYRRALAVAGSAPIPPIPHLRWRGALGLALLAWGPILAALGIIVVPSGMAGRQIEQSMLEAQARKEATVKNAEAMAEAKVIDSKVERERRKMLSNAEADRIRVTAAADPERMQSEGAQLRQDPLLINKIIAERLSDKLQIMMVPSDSKVFFTNDSLRGMNVAHRAAQADKAESAQK
jgi:hypothetical protein